MPRYLIERTFGPDFNIPGPGASGQTHLLFLENNTRAGVVWLVSFVSPDRRKSFCLYEAPSVEALRQAALRNDLPVDRITEVSLFEARAAGF